MHNLFYKEQNSSSSSSNMNVILLVIMLASSVCFAKLSDDQFWNAIKYVESSGDENAVGDNGMSIGPLQIQKHYYKDAVERNPALQSGKYEGFTYENCKGPGSFEYSRAVAESYMRRYATKQRLGRPPTYEDMARIHNGGPNGFKSKATLKYWERVKKALEYSVRLTGGNRHNAGRLEIYHNSQWKTVCDDGWGWEESDVVCKSLGYPLGAQDYVYGAHYGQGSGRILLDDVQCTGSESGIMECRHRGIHIHNCHHSEDIGIVCAVRQQITHLYVIYGQSSSPPSGYTKISVDLNKGAGGDYIYLCYKKGVRRPITGLTVSAGGSSSFSVPSGYTRICKDLNKGAGGDYIYVDYTKNVDLLPINSVTVIYGRTANIYPQYGWVKINTDCNKGAGGDYIYICYYQRI